MQTCNYLNNSKSRNVKTTSTYNVFFILLLLLLILSENSLLWRPCSAWSPGTDEEREGKVKIGQKAKCQVSSDLASQALDKTQEAQFTAETSPKSYWAKPFKLCFLSPSKFCASASQTLLSNWFDVAKTWMKSEQRLILWCRNPGEMICKNGCSHKINFLDINLRISTAIMVESDQFISLPPTLTRSKQFWSRKDSAFKIQ